MHYQNVCLESIAYSLPDEVLTSDEIEDRLAPLYRRLNLPEGRLELMTGIRERRFWPEGTLPSQVSTLTAQKALAAAELDKRHVGLLIHGSVCRDVLEPATASRVHRGLDLPRACLVYDVSNACLGLLNGMLQAANMIELGQVEAAIVVGTEGGRQLVETTIAALNADTSLSRQDVKLAVASLTIGSASAAIVLANRELSRTGNRLTAGLAYCDTSHVDLCHSGADEAVASGMTPLMRTDSERLLEAGVGTAADCFPQFLAATGWHLGQIDKTICHQVGKAHRAAVLDALGLDESLDFSTVEFLGNTGSAALPVTAAMAVERGHIQPRDRVAFLGIGSGINVLMLGVEWQRSWVSPRPAGGPREKLGVSRRGVYTP
jgi:3-oxoacyl-[acyl-carrier-protein] synthase-3